ncbi:hypothetical protein DFH28DRAFT_942827 [Melampsora americana]|nr:hypothetical protein DFH28DRAFT_942827 [Melampsora americana]
MTLIIHLIAKILIVSINQVECVSLDKSMATTSTTSESYETTDILNIASGTRMKALTPKGPQKEPQWSSSTCYENQNNVKSHTLSNHTPNVKESNNKNKNSLFDLNLPYTISAACGTQNNLEVHESPHHQLNAKESQGQKRKLAFDLNIPDTTSLNEMENNSPKHQKTMNVDKFIPDNGFGKQFGGPQNIPSSIGFVNQPKVGYDKGVEIFAHRRPRPNLIALIENKRSEISKSIESKTSLDSTTRENHHEELNDSDYGISIHKYIFKESGEQVILADYRVKIVEGTWHVMPSHPDMVIKMKHHGMEIASQAGLHPKTVTIDPWFQALEEEMQDKMRQDTQSHSGSSEIYLAVFKAYRHLTMGFLASLQMIHSADLEGMNELTVDGLNFVKQHLKSWRQVNWKGALVQPINVSDCLETHTTFQLLSYLLRLSKTSTISMCVFWSLYNNWYNVSHYKQKKKSESLQDFITTIHYHLARANSFPQWEVEPFKISTISIPKLSNLQKGMDGIHFQGRNIHDQIRFSNTSMKINRCKRAVTMMKTVGNRVLETLLSEGLSLDFIKEYCDHMSHQEVKLPHDWKGNFKSLEHMVKNKVFPGFIGVIQLLHPVNTKQGQQNIAVLEGFHFIQRLLKGWGENDLGRACKMSSWKVRRFDIHDEKSIYLLVYLMRLSPAKEIPVASSIFWGLYKAWGRSEGSEFVEGVKFDSQAHFLTAIENSYKIQG